ncbi:MAG: HD domain-containing protein [Armatimonadota bacterium]
MSASDELIAFIERTVYARLADWPAQWEGYHWPGYTWEHTLRVRALALRLADEVGAQRRVVELAALLHDIEKQAGPEHAAAGAVTAQRLLTERGADAELTGRVIDAIASHAGGNTPQHRVESLVLGDADLIDANFGLVGVWRFITIRAGHGAGVAETIAAMGEWLPKKDALLELLHTGPGRAVARERTVRMHEFCADLAGALADGRARGGLIALAEHINAHHARGSILDQLPALRRIAADHGEDVAQAAVERLADEAAGRA